MEIWENALSAYYLTLLLLKHAHDVRGASKCWLSFLPRQTTKNTLRMLSNLIVRCCHWPLDEVFEPSATCEDAIEYFFGYVKTFKRGIYGTTTTANAIQSTQLIHLRQSRKVPQAGGRRGPLGNLRISPQSLPHEIL